MTRTRQPVPNTDSLHYWKACNTRRHIWFQSGSVVETVCRNVRKLACVRVMPDSVVPTDKDGCDDQPSVRNGCERVDSLIYIYYTILVGVLRVKMYDGEQTCTHL
jgi:hypothetical protein